MKYQIPMMFALLALAACGDHGEADCSDPDVECDPGGTTHYSANNQTSYDLTMKLVLVAQLGSGTTSIPIPANQEVPVFEDHMIGVNPKPTDTFVSMQILVTPAGGGDPDVAYAQDPIRDDAWAGGRVDVGDYGLSEYVFTVSETDLALP